MFNKVYSILETSDSLVLDLIENEDSPLLVGDEHFGNYSDDKGSQPYETS